MNPAPPAAGDDTVDSVAPDLQVLGILALSAGPVLVMAGMYLGRGVSWVSDRETLTGAAGFLAVAAAMTMLACWSTAVARRPLRWFAGGALVGGGLLAASVGTARRAARTAAPVSGDVPEVSEVVRATLAFPTSWPVLLIPLAVLVATTRGQRHRPPFAAALVLATTVPALGLVVVPLVGRAAGLDPDGVPTDDAVGQVFGLAVLLLWVGVAGTVLLGRAGWWIGGAVVAGPLALLSLLAGPLGAALGTGSVVSGDDYWSSVGWGFAAWYVWPLWVVVLTAVATAVTRGRS